MNKLNPRIMADALENKFIHIAKETLVITILKKGETDLIPRPILVLPICSKNSANYIKIVIEIIIKELVIQQVKN